MNFKLEYFVVIVLFIVLIGLATSGSSMSFHPYDGNKAQYSNVENFEVYPETGSLSPDLVDNKTSDVNSDSYGVSSVFGFKGLYSSPYGKNVPIDPLYNVTGDEKCTGNSSGYSDSRGGLCLTKPVLKLFQTRGGNQSETPMQIGH